MTFTLPKLPYAFDALEPHIDARTMEIHHGKHHAGYVAKLNAALEGQEDLANMDIAALCGSLGSVPEDLRGAARNNGGGHYNHSLFWTSLSGDGCGAPDGDLADAITATFGSFDDFKANFAAEAGSRFGSGWAWLCKCADGVCVCSTPNQDNPLMRDDACCTPLLGLDVWEHAYYLNYQNRRPDYIEAFWNLVNWSAVADRFTAAKSNSCCCS